MFDNEDLDQTIRMAIFDLMLTLYHQGITEVHMGGVMRILGVDNETASQHDGERVLLDEQFANYVKAINEPRPPNQTLH
jgi:hypothetical protein